MCDGMGGHAAGEVASTLAVKTIQKVVEEHAAALQSPETGEGRARALVSLMRSAVEDANRAVHTLSRSEKTMGAGTTCTSLLVREGKAALGHVGDSRAYLSRDGQLHQLSTDHTFAAEAIAKGVLTEKEVAGIPEAAYLTRAVGPHASVVVDTLLFDLLPSDTLLLCSDGLHGYFESDSELLDLLDEPMEEVAEKLIGFANERGGEDNITAVVLRVRADEAEDEEDCDRITQVAADLEALRHIDLLAELSQTELMRVSQVLRSAQFDKGEVILRQGDATESLMVLVGGSAHVDRNGERIATLQSGSHFGEMALLTQRPRTATVRAVEPCRVLILEREAFYLLAQQDAVMGVKFLWKLAQTLSTRLDESYALTPKSDASRTTVRYGMFPSPFSKR